MQWQQWTKSNGLAMLLVACGPEAAQEASPETQASQSDRLVLAMAPPDSCAPDVDVGWCRINTDRIRCANGRYVHAYSTPDGYCIHYDACKNQGEPNVCGLQPRLHSEFPALTWAGRFECHHVHGNTSHWHTKPTMISKKALSPANPPLQTRASSQSTLNTLQANP
jgi:hypothetical protein